MIIVIIGPPLCDQVRDRAVAREGARLEEGAAGTPPLVFYLLPAPLNLPFITKVAINCHHLTC